MSKAGRVFGFLVLLIIAIAYYIWVLKQPPEAKFTIKEGGVVDIRCPGADGTDSSKNAKVRSAQFGAPPTAGQQGTCRPLDVTAQVKALMASGKPFNASRDLVLTPAQLSAAKATNCPPRAATNQLTVKYACPVATTSGESASTSYGNKDRMGDPNRTRGGGRVGGGNRIGEAESSCRSQLGMGRRENFATSHPVTHHWRGNCLGMRAHTYPPGSQARPVTPLVKSLYSRGPPTDAGLATDLGLASPESASSFGTGRLADSIVEQELEALGSAPTHGQISYSAWGRPALAKPGSVRRRTGWL